MPIARKGERARQASMAFWVGAVQASKPWPVKGFWTLRGSTATAGVTEATGAREATEATGTGGVSVRACARTLCTASGVAP